MMEVLKQRLFDVLAKAITVEEFENWLYKNENITSSIDENDMFFDIVTMNYRSKHIYWELEKYCHKYYDYEEYLVALVESGCRKLVRENISEKIWPVITHIGSFMDWDKNYGLINQFYYLEDDLYLVQDDLLKEEDVLKYIKKMAGIILAELESLSIDDKLEILKTGIEVNNEKPKFRHTGPLGFHETNKKWYQFWK